jgi:hypothetical protein
VKKESKVNVVNEVRYIDQKKALKGKEGNLTNKSQDKEKFYINQIVIKMKLKRTEKKVIQNGV